jgi:hypothetical protein
MMQATCRSDEAPLIRRWYFGSGEIFFYGYEIQDAGTNKGGDMSLSLHAAPVLSDDDASPAREVSHQGS